MCTFDCSLELKAGHGDVIVLLSAVRAAEQVAKYPEESKHTANYTEQLLYYEDLLGQTVKTRTI